MRTTERRRDRTLAALGDGYAAGCMGTETLGFRVEAAYQARTARELRSLTADLPAHGLRDALDRVRAWVATPVVEAKRPAVRIAPPPDGPGPWTLGRSERCRLSIDAPTVSRTHAEVRRHPDGRLEIRDLGSTNGTWVNGWRVERATLSDGDELLLGEVRVVFA